MRHFQPSKAAAARAQKAAVAQKNVQQLIIGIGIMTNCNLNILHEFYENDMKILFCDNRFRAASCFGP